MRPVIGDYAEYYQKYIDLVKGSCRTKYGIPKRFKFLLRKQEQL